LPLPQRNPPTLLRGDCWPGNLLWQHDQLVAIIDWEDAATREPLPTSPTPVLNCSRSSTPKPCTSSPPSTIP
jgi:hypothetical protein